MNDRYDCYWKQLVKLSGRCLQAVPMFDRRPPRSAVRSKRWTGGQTTGWQCIRLHQGPKGTKTSQDSEGMVGACTP
jgi:hypothetical protein